MYEGRTFSWLAEVEPLSLACEALVTGCMPYNKRCVDYGTERRLMPRPPTRSRLMGALTISAVGEAASHVEPVGHHICRVVVAYVQPVLSPARQSGHWGTQLRNEGAAGEAGWVGADFRGA